MINYLSFAKEGLKDLKTMGTVSRSSRFVCKEMISHVDFQDADIIVELGAGDGVITKHILRNMQADTSLIAFEVNNSFCDSLRTIKDERLIIAEDSAEKLEEYLAHTGYQQIDYIISAIPFVMLPKELGIYIVNECHKYLKKGGLFIQLHYSLMAKKLYEGAFGNVNVNFIPINFPPAFILVSKKE